MGEGERSRRVLMGLLGFAGVATLLIVVATAAASPLQGTLDHSFGHNGRVVSDLGVAFADSKFTSMVRQPDGKLLLTATVEKEDGGTEWIVQRRGPAGDLDPSFGSGGIVSVSSLKDSSRPEGLAVQGDGRILVGGRGDECAPISTVRRLLPDGSLDPSFGNSGVSATLPLSIDRIAVDTEGRILVAGSAIFRGRCGKNGPSRELAIARVQANGSLDPSFGSGGVVRTRAEGMLEETSASGLAVREDGTILVAGGPAGSLLGLTTNGALDSSFGNDGAVELAGGPRALLTLPGNEAMVASSTSLHCCLGRPGDFLLSRYAADGTFNAGFGNGGQVSLDVGALDEASALALAPDGSVLLAGGTAGAGDCRSGECVFTSILARFSATGALDPGFGQGGWIAVEHLGEASFHSYGPQIAALAISPNGQILAAGGDERRSDAFVIAREPSGQPDLTFGRAGLVDEIRTQPSTTRAIGLAIEPGGGILVSARSSTGEHGMRGILLGFKSNGRSDPKIGSGGGFVPIGAMGPARAGGANRVYIVGEGHVVRLDSRGRPDDDYGTHGIARLPDGFRASSSLARRNGKVLVAGRVGHRRGMAAFQLTPRGRPDRSFGRDGLAFAGFGVKFESEAQSVAVDAEGRIVLVGRVGADAAALRLLSSGRPDPRFGRHGRVGPLPVLGADAMDVALQADGRILIAASPEAATQSGLTSLVRLGRNGARDRSFDRDGVLRVRGKASLLSVFANGRQIILLTKRGFFGEGFGVVLRAYRTNGAVDRRFGRRGIASAATSQSRLFRPTAASRQPNGRIVVVGTTGKNEGPGADVELLRFR
jgi:uncharacterized delta-60 repeat protein